MTRSTTSVRHQRRRLALILPSHNEELILQATIKSAVAAGQKLEDIYVVDDASVDNTRQVALSLLPNQNVLTVERSGKALAILKAVKYFRFVERYVWMHVTDADSVFGPNYFKIFRSKLNAKKYGIAIGFVQSLRGGVISKYRVLGYTYGQQVVRRVQNILGMISVFPGPVTCFKTDLIKHLDFDVDSLTEDFDITLQFYRKRLGEVLYVPKAVNFTQDPLRYRDFCKQTARWYRGFFQGVRKYKIGTSFKKIDLSIWYQLTEVILFLIQFLVLIPLVAIATGSFWIVPTIMLGDFLTMAAMALFATVATKRVSILSALPAFYFLRWTEVFIFCWAFMEIYLFRRYRSGQTRGWAIMGRRYKLSRKALKDVAS